MSESTEDFEKQVKIFEKKVMEAIEINPQLLSYKLGLVTLIPKEEEVELVKEGFKNFDSTFSAEIIAKDMLRSNLVYVRLRRCKINNQPYPGSRCPWHPGE